jgi:hypothetical protein
MGFLDRFRRRPAAAEEDPWAEEAAPQPGVTVVNPWKPQRNTIGIIPVKVPKGDDVWRLSRLPSAGLKNRVLHGVSGVMILLNVVVGLFFYSNNVTLNAALLGYLGVSTVLLGHYFALTR